jgi:ParB family chromosome partitioning protein
MPRKSSREDPATVTMPIADVQVGTRIRRDLGDIDGLAASIEELGLLHPIVVTPLGELIAGARRLAACTQLGWTSIPVTVVDLDEIVRGEMAENVSRKEFTPSEIAAVAARMRPLEERAARERQREAGRLVGSGVAAGKFPEASTAGRVREKIAALVGVSDRTVAKIEAVVAAAARDPEFAPLIEQMDRTGKVDAAYRAVRQAEVPKAPAAVPCDGCGVSTPGLAQVRTFDDRVNLCQDCRSNAVELLFEAHSGVWGE